VTLNGSSEPAGEVWPELPLAAWAETRDTLHLWTQVVGKVRLALAPMVNHWWQVPLYVTCRGLTTSPVPYGTRTFQVNFDFIKHRLLILTSDGREESFPLRPGSVAGFHAEVTGRLRALGIEVRIWTTPVELEDPVPFEADRRHAAYDAGYAHRFWHVLVQADRVLAAFRARFLGKVSPVHFFWGSFDLAVTRFSGRPAPRHPGAPNVADSVTREAYSHEVSSCGFWPGAGGLDAMFYAYAYPQPPGFADVTVRPAAASYSRDLGEFVLPYDALRRAEAPDATLLEFLQGTYAAAADLADWDRAALERGPG
jgi:hypothetical protein